MRSNALYFPYIALPDDTWTAKSLLYWDKLSSIVPMDYLQRPEQMSDFMRTLLTEGLVEPVIPAHHIHQIRRFDDSFIELVERRLRQRHQHIVAPVSARVPTRIHAEKLGEIPRFLVESGLAKQVDWAWYDMETATANQFMSYLAACLGAIPEVDAAPVTDKAIFASGLRSHPKRSVPTLHQHKSREVVLRHLLPTPAGPVQVDKLLLFKRRYGHLLPPLRARVEAHCTYVATLSDPNDRIEANEAFLLESKQSIAEIEGAMRPTFGKVVLGSLAPLFGAGLSLQAMASGDVKAYTGAALSLAGAAYQAIASIRGGRALVNHPLAYVAHAKCEFGANSGHRMQLKR
ncbi:hypothetical protein [Paraburkholderia acidipaludis]|uniref:hypothetical protein n=1 Tax=Paraburkholderia acidipaludis TaxID=660537 RepID=UPI0004863A2E|nr:hypothetical protein [Paraburkholderia acidipaludis]